ncbi:hypothetical protein [uncultured Mediterranean phage]|nr:hypothetical protein [uncultured Mediterranean phage]
MAIIKFSKVGPADRPAGEAGLISAKVDLMKAQRGAASMQAALSAVQLGDAVMRSKPLSAAVDELKYRGGQLYDWATDKPTPAEDRVEAMRKEAAAAGTQAGAPPPTQTGAPTPTPAPTQAGAQPPAQEPSMYDRAVGALTSAATSASDALGHPRVVAARRMGKGSPASLARIALDPSRPPRDRARALLEAAEESAAGQEAMKALNAADSLSRLTDWVGSTLGNSDSGGRLSRHVTPEHTPEQVGRAKVRVAMGEDPETALAAAAPPKPGSAASVLDPAFDPAQHPVDPADPKTTLEMGLGRALQVARTPSKATERGPGAQTRRAEIMEWIQALDENRRKPKGLPSIEVLDQKSLGGLILLAESQLLSDEDEATLVVLAREKAVSNGLANIAGGKYMTEAADKILKAQSDYRKGVKPLDLVKASVEISKADKASARALFYESKEVQARADAATEDAMRAPRTYHMWAKLAGSASFRKMWARKHAKRSGRGVGDLTKGFDFAKGLTDKTQNTGTKDSNHDIYLRVSSMPSKRGRLALANLTKPYEIGLKAQSIQNRSDTVGLQLDLIQAKIDAMGRKNVNPQYAAELKRAHKRVERLENHKFTLREGSQYIDTPAFDAAKKELGEAEKSLEALQNSQPDEPPVMPRPTPERRKRREKGGGQGQGGSGSGVNNDSTDAEKLAAGWTRLPHGGWLRP